jgi:hypothetical protein
MHSEQQTAILTIALFAAFADGRQREAERAFLAELKSLLKLDAGQTESFERDADVIVELSEVAAPAAECDALARPPALQLLSLPTLSRALHHCREEAIRAMQVR